MHFGLAPDVYMAIVDGDVVLLDARSDRYACLAACDAEAIRAGHAERRWRDGSLVRELAEAGYLMPASNTKATPRPSLFAPDQDIYMLAGDVPPITPLDLIDAAVSGLATAWRLKTQQPRYWLRRPSHDWPENSCIPLARRFAEALLYLPGLTRCLPRSLALIDFLDRHGSGAQLVFGVRTHPFEAHCWVQSGNVVLNDTFSRISWYTPIAWN